MRHFFTLGLYNPERRDRLIDLPWEYTQISEVYDELDAVDTLEDKKQADEEATFKRLMGG